MRQLTMPSFLDSYHHHWAKGFSYPLLFDMSSYPTSSSVTIPLSKDCLDSHLMGGMASRGPGLVPSVRQ